MASSLFEERPDLQVFYDHGDSSTANVGKIYGHFGDRATRTTNLAEVDIMVANAANEILLLIEVEERTALNPKKILGVLMAILLSERFSFEGQAFSTTPETVFICAGIINPNGSNAKKITKGIAPRIEKIKAQYSNIGQIKYVLEENVAQVIGTTERLCHALLIS